MALCTLCLRRVGKDDMRVCLSCRRRLCLGCASRTLFRSPGATDEGLFAILGWLCLECTVNVQSSTPQR